MRDRNSYPWHDHYFRPPAFPDLIVYQFHVGRFSAGGDRRPHRVAKFLDVLDRVEYFADLGVTALQPLPVVEFQGEWSLATTAPTCSPRRWIIASARRVLRVVQGDDGGVIEVDDDAVRERPRSGVVSGAVVGVVTGWSSG